MIHADQVMQMIVEACPDFKTAWEEHHAYWYGGEQPLDAPNLHVDVGPLNTFLLEQLRQGITTCFPALFNLLEQLLGEGDDYVRDWVVTGVFEGLMNKLSKGEQDYTIFDRWLGATSRQEWRNMLIGWGRA